MNSGNPLSPSGYKPENHYLYRGKLVDVSVTVKSTTVWKETATLRKDLLIENRFFDLLELDGLYVFKVGSILKEWRNRTGVSQTHLNRLMKRNKDYFGLVERNIRGLPLRRLFILGKNLGVIKDRIGFYKLLGVNDVFFGSIGKSNRIKLPLPSSSKDILNKICLAKKHTFRVSIKKEISSRERDALKEKFNFKIEKKDYDGCERHYIRSLTFNSFLRKFFRFEKKCKLHFPLTQYVASRKNKIDLVRGIILPLLQSDGCPWTFTNKCKEFHDIIVDAFYYHYGVLPTSYMIQCEGDSAYNTTFPNIDNKIKKELLSISGNVKTTPAVGQSKEDFLKEPQPHLDYLLESDRETQIAGLQMYFAAEGWVQFYETHGGYAAPLLGIACSHPTVHFGLIELCKKFNAKMLSTEKSNWTGLGELLTTGLIQVINLIRIEPFVDGIFISRGHFKNHLKKEALLSILEYRHREKQKLVNHKIPREAKIKNIKSILNNKEFKNKNYYVKLHERGEI